MRTWLQTNNQGTALFKVVLQSVPISGEGEGGESILLKIPLHVGGINSVRPVREQSVLDMGGFGIRISGEALLPLPVLHHHGNAGGTASVLLLLHKGDVDPDAGRFGQGDNTAAQPHDDSGSADATQHRSLKSTHGDNDQDESSDANEDDQQIPLAHTAGRKVGLPLVRPRCQLSEFSIAQAGNRSLYLLGIHVR